MEAKREHIDPGWESGFVTRRLSMERFDSIYHFHPEYELTWIQSSSGHVVVGDYLGPFGPGHLVLLGPNLTHWYYNDPLMEGGADWSRALLVQFSRDCLGDALLGQPEMKAINDLLKQSSRGILFRPPSKRLELLMESLLVAKGPERILLLIKVLHVLSRNPKVHLMASSLHAEEVVPVGSRRLRRVVDYIHGSYTETLTLESLAQLAHMSPSAFSRFFHKRMGLPVSRYILLYRLTAAARQLVETEKTVSEIAFAVGFNNLTHFNRQFRKWKKQTPSAFRKLLRTSYS